MRARRIGLWCAAIVGAAVVAAAAAGPAPAQVSSDPAQITTCLCLQQGVAALSADMSAKTQALAAIRQHLADLDAQLAHGRNYDVNNPDAVARYKSLVEQRDGAYRQSIGPVVSQADQATARYNAHVSEYNASCANHLFNSAMMADIQAHLACPPLR